MTITSPFLLVSIYAAAFLLVAVIQPGAWAATDNNKARVSCNAAYSAPCARTNSEWLAKRTAQTLAAAAAESTTITAAVESKFQDITAGRYNLDTGFYPFVYDQRSGLCVAHGANTEWLGLTLDQIFERQGIGFSDADALWDRFLAAAGSGGGWVQYLWNDNLPGTGSKKTKGIRSKLAHVLNITGTPFLVGVGYENEPLPADLPCSSTTDAWCSITNVRSLVGAAQFLLYQAESLASFEAAAYQLSFDADQFQIPGGFYTFLYHYRGPLMAHAILHDSFGKTLAEIVPEKQLGTAVEGLALHNAFVQAAEGQGSGWVQYQWRNSLEEETYTKIAFLVKIVFELELYYLGVGFNFAMEEQAPDSERCSDKYNLPCAFKTSLQLSSHALAHVVSFPSSVNEAFDVLSYVAGFKRDDFYVFVYDFNSTCVAHGGVPDFVGLTLGEVFNYNGITLDADRLHDQFRTAASRGGGWVLYDWVVPGVADSTFQKISYLFQMNINGRDYYGGVGFNHQRAPVHDYTGSGRTKGGSRIPCTAEFGPPCSERNSKAILGQALADLTLAALSETNSDISSDSNSPQAPSLDQILWNINNQEDDTYKVNDFTVGVFSVDGSECEVQDGSGCCIAHSSHQGKTWQQILNEEGVTSIRGSDLHERLVAQSNTGGGELEYPWSRGFGQAQTKRASTARFRNEGGSSYYVVSEYFTTPQPYTCDACPSDMECTDNDQWFCEEKGDPPLRQEPGFVFLIVLFCVVIPGLICFFWFQKRRSKARSRAKIQALDDQMKEMAKRMEQQMQGMVEVVHDMPIQSPTKYMYKVESSERIAASMRSEASAIWYWEEDEAYLDRHKPAQVLTDTKFVSYAREHSEQIERAYRRWQEGRGFNQFQIDLSNKITKFHNPNTGANFELNFESMTQKNLKSQYERNIRREEVDIHIDSHVAGELPPLPDDIDFSDEAEDLLPTFTGQVIQVSKVHPNRQWLFGNVLYDPLMNEAAKSAKGTDDRLNTVIANALHDRPTSGWFPRSVTKPASTNVMQKLLKTLGGEGMDTLTLPDTWDESLEGRVNVPKGSSEYQEVADYFMAALYSQMDKVKVHNVERIQNVPLWQSYAVKKQTMKTRDAANPQHRVNNLDPNGLERRWLFHGTTTEVIPKIEKQGFNRAFAGRNAVVYGKGVYFARDASYSSHKAYSQPDSKGIQRMFLCRVAVGDWCKGVDGQLTPDPKPHNNLELFDSTVDNLNSPSIFVVYHDAQAYPEYLVSFKRK